MGFIGVYRAVYDYVPQADGELAITEGDLLFILEKDDDWWRAKKKAPNEEEEEPEGLIPNNYVEEAKATANAKALYDYDRQTDEEISFAADDELHVYDTTDEDWTLVGHNGEYGFAPANYIEIHADAPPTPKRPTVPANTEDHTLYEEESSSVPAPAPLPMRREPSDSSEDSPSRNPAAALAGILASKSVNGASSSPSTRRVQFTPEESEEDVPAPNLPRRRPSEASPPASIPAQPAVRQSSTPARGINSPDLRVQNVARADVDAPLQSPRGFHIYNIYEMAEAMGRRKKMPVTLGINVAKGVIMLSPEQSTDSQEWTAEKMTHYAIEGKHVFVELVRPSKSIDFHAGQKDTANEIVMHLGELAGAVRGEGLKEIVAAASGVDQKTGKMLYDFVAAGDDEVSCAIGDEVLILDDSNDEWWLVKRQKNGKSGVVPSNYVERTRPGAGSAAPKSPTTLQPPISFVEQNRQEEKRLARKAAESQARDTREAEVGPGLRLPERNSSLYQGDNVSKASQKPSSRDTRDAKSSDKKSLPDKLKCRTWTDRSGTFKVEAEFLGLKDGKIHLHKLNGVKIAVPVTKMSIEDLEYVEWATGVSLDEDKPLSDIKRRNTQKSSDRSKDSSSRSKTGATTDGSSKPDYDWFDFFLSCGVNPQICERYASAFSRDQMGEENLVDINPALLRTLGLKEGDILRVMKQLDTKFGRNKSAGEANGTEAGGVGGLFSGPGGALRDNTRKGRPAPPVETTNVVDPKVFEIKDANKTPSPTVAAPSATAKSASNDLLGGFDDNAWEPRASKSPVTTPPPATTLPPSAAPAPVGAMAEMSLLTPALQPSTVPAASSESTGRPSSAAAQPTGATPSLFEQLANSKANAALNAPRQRPGAPQQQFTGDAALQPPPNRAASAPQNPNQQSAFSPPPLQPQLTGYQSQAPLQLQMRTGVVPPGTSMEEQIRMQQMQQQLQPLQNQLQQQQEQIRMLMSQPTGYQQQPNAMGMPNALQPQPTGFPGQFGGYQQSQPGMPPFMGGPQASSPFADPPRAAFQPQATGFLQPQPTGINSFLPPALVPQPTGMAPPTSFGGQQGFGQQVPPMPPMPPMPQNQNQLQPLVPQKTGPPPPVRFGVGGQKKLVPQPTGKRANLAAATPQNPFGF